MVNLQELLSWLIMRLKNSMFRGARRKVKENTLRMKTGVFRNTNVNFLFVIIFLLMFLVLLITEVTVSTFYRSHLQQNQNYISAEVYNFQLSDSGLKNQNATYPRDGVWQNVAGSRYKFFVFSAYLDNRSKRQWLIRLIGATRTKSPGKSLCILHYENRDERTPARIMAISENWSLPYSAVFIVCHLKNITQVPTSVSISAYDKLLSVYVPASNNVLINNRNVTDLTLTKNKDKIAVCVKPIHYNYFKTIELIEFIELNRLMGVDHFTFYNTSSSLSTSCVLDEYIREGIASVYPWQLDIVSKIEIRTEGMFAALNDCLYRNMYKYPYVAFIDLDEFIVPRHNSTLIDLIKWLGVRYNTSMISAFSFQNAFFYMQWADDPNIKFGNDIEKHLVTIRKTRRRVKLNAHKQRSKYICKPKNVVEVGNHFVWQSFPHQSTLHVPADIAILNHYRVCEFGGDDCVHLLSTVDRTTYRYRKVLACNVAQKWLPLIDKCNLPRIRSFNFNSVCSA